MCELSSVIIHSSHTIWGFFFYMLVKIMQVAAWGQFWLISKLGVSSGLYCSIFRGKISRMLTSKVFFKSCKKFMASHFLNIGKKIQRVLWNHRLNLAWERPSSYAVRNVAIPLLWNIRQWKKAERARFNQHRGGIIRADRNILWLNLFIY